MSDNGVTDIGREIARRHLNRQGVAGAVKHNAWSQHEAMLNGARNDLRSAVWSHERAEERYEAAKREFLSTGDDLDRAKARLAGLEAAREQ